MQELLVSLESTGLARIVGGSLWVTAGLSAFHALGFTIVMSAGVVWNLRASGLLLRDTAVESIARPSVRLLVLGLAISLTTGFALFAPRASYTGLSGTFQLKITLLFVAAIHHFAVGTSVLRRSTVSTASLRANGALGALLWLALAVTACWFILFE